MPPETERKDTVPDAERALAQEIARAMQPPLMSRLARIERMFPELMSLDPDAAAATGAPALPAGPPPPPVPLRLESPVAAAAPPAFEPAPVDAIADDPDQGWATPPSVEWLGRARRERNRARLRNAVAWLATLAIGGGIVVATMLALQP